MVRLNLNNCYDPWTLFRDILSQLLYQMYISKALHSIGEPQRVA